MCGIAGQVLLQGGPAPDPELVVAMVRAITHRGPDGEARFADPGGRAALGARRLAIIDLVTGEQPVFNEDRSVACAGPLRQGCEGLPRAETLRALGLDGRALRDVVEEHIAGRKTGPS